MSRILSLFLCAALAAAQQPAGSPPPSVKEQVLLIPAGAMVEVKLKDKRKLRGRMGAATDDTFVVQHAQNNKLVEEKVSFSDVRSVKAKERGLNSAAFFGLGAAAGAGGLMLISLIWLLLN